MTLPYWTTRSAHPSEAAAILRLAAAVHGPDRPELNHDYLRWRYWSDTPFRAEIIVAEHQGRLIGMQPVAIFDFRRGDDRLRGAMYTGVLTHPEHRRRGVFRSLIDAANRYAAAHRAAFCMTMPNDASLPGFRKFGDWINPGHIPTFFKVLNGPALLREKVGRWAGVLFGWAARLLERPRYSFVEPGSEAPGPTEMLPDDLDLLAEQAARESGGLMLHRSADYWRWRYLDRPTASYRPTRRMPPAYHTLTVRESGETLGIAVTSTARQAGVEVGLIVDLMARGGELSVRRLLQKAEDDIFHRGAALVVCQATNPMLRRALSDAGYVHPPARWLPRRFHFVYRRTEIGNAALPDLLDGWYLTFGDSDNT